MGPRIFGLTRHNAESGMLHQAVLHMLELGSFRSSSCMKLVSHQHQAHPQLTSKQELIEVVFSKTAFTPPSGTSAAFTLAISISELSSKWPSHQRQVRHFRNRLLHSGFNQTFSSFATKFCARACPFWRKQRSQSSQRG